MPPKQSMASDPPASMTSAIPDRTIWKASPIAWFDEAQAVDTVSAGPRSPCSMLTALAAALAIRRGDGEGVDATLTLLEHGPVAVVHCAKAAAAGPEEHACAQPGLTVKGQSRLNTASDAAITANCVKRSKRESCWRSKRAAGSKFLTCAPMRMWSRSASRMSERAYGAATLAHRLQRGWHVRSKGVDRAGPGDGDPAH
jgi:hypothetical protein